MSDADPRSAADLTGIPGPALQLVREAVGCGEVAADAELEGRPPGLIDALDEQAREAEEAALAHGDSAWVADDDEEPPADPVERGRRRDSLRRMHAGLSPMIQPHEITYDDEGPDGVLVPINYALPGGGSWNPPMPMSAGQRQAEVLRQEEIANARAEYHRRLAEQHGRPVRFEVMTMPGGSEHPYDRARKLVRPSFTPFRPRKPPHRT